MLEQSVPHLYYDHTQTLISWSSALQSLPDLPEFALSLRPEGYELPSTDSIWANVDSQPQIQSLKEHLDDEDEVETK